MWYAGWNTILFSKGQPTLLTHSALSPHSSRPVLHSFTSKTRRNRWFWLASLSCPFCHTRLFQRLFLCPSLSGWSPCYSLNTSSTTLLWGHNTIWKLLTPMAKMHGCLLCLLNEAFPYHLSQILITPPPLFILLSLIFLHGIYQLINSLVLSVFWLDCKVHKKTD